MPLHDWAVLPGWDGVRQVWIVELLYWIKPRLPAGYRAYIGATPTFAIGAPAQERPDVGVRDWPLGEPPSGITEAGENQTEEPDQEVAVAALAGDTALLVERQGRLVAAVELVSPRNKDRTSAQDTYTGVYASYLRRGVNLVLVDVLARPTGFSFPDRIAGELELEQPPLPPPCAVAYRVDGPAPNGGRFLALWRRPLSVGSPLPALPLPLTPEQSVLLDLESTYTRAADAAYLS